MSSQANTEVRRIRADSLRIHPRAQRRLVPATVRKIRANLDLDGIGTLHAVEYVINGVLALWIIDGQHRLAALLQEGLGEWVVTVEVHLDVKDDARSAALFKVLNTKAGVHPFDTYAVELVAREDTAVGVDRVVGKHGLRVERSVADGVVACVGALKATYERDNGAALDKTLETATAAWGHTAAAVEGKLIEGMGLVFAHYNGEVDQPAMVKKLAKFPGGAHGVLARARNLKDIRSATLGRCVAEVVVEAYNKGRRTGCLDLL